MANTKFKHYVFDEVVRLATIAILVMFGIFLVFTKSELARDIVLLIIGLIGGKYLRT